MQAIKSIGESICGQPPRSAVLPPARRKLPRWQFRDLAMALAVTAVVAAIMTFHPSAAHADEEEEQKAVAANSLARMPNLQGNIAAIREGKRVYHVHCAECHGNIQFHYSLPRRLSMREAARIQSFPDPFVFAAKLRETERQIGNAVPPVLAWYIAKAVRDCLL